jgi:DNA-binding NarL/FixJ family response regulator
MPKIDGLDALRQIKAAHSQTHVVMLTVSDEDLDLFEAIKSGADGYLLKSLNAEEFLEYIRGLERGEMAISRRMATRLITSMAGPAQRRTTRVGTLTPREIEVLRLTAEGLPNKTIATRLSVSENTIKYHLKKIMGKLNAQNRAEAVGYAVRSGIYKPPEAS